MKTAKDVLKAIKDNDVKYVDLRFTDPRGKWQHVTFDQTIIDEEALRRRPDVRRLVDRRLEGDQRIRHDLDAGSDLGLHGPVLRRLDDGHQLRHSRSRQRPALQPRPARHRQEGGSLPEVDRHRRHRLLRPGSRILRLRRRPLQGRPLQHQRHRSTRSSCRSTPTRPTRAATSATACAPRAATSPSRRKIRRRTCAAKCSRRWRRWARWSRSTTTKSPPRSTNSASSSAR